jgi:hypothetical protein
MAPGSSTAWQAACLKAARKAAALFGEVARDVLAGVAEARAALDALRGLAAAGLAPTPAGLAVIALLVEAAEEACGRLRDAATRALHDAEVGEARLTEGGD